MPQSGCNQFSQSSIVKMDRYTFFLEPNSARSTGSPIAGVDSMMSGEPQPGPVLLSLLGDVDPMLLN